MDTTTAGFDLARANIDAQRAFRDMLIAGVYGDPDAPETRAYIAAERRLDDLFQDVQWEASKAKLDLALGDHYAGMPS